MISILRQLYNRTKAKHRKLDSRLKKKLRSGEFGRQTRRRQYSEVQSVRKSGLQLNKLHLQLVAAGGALAIATGPINQVAAQDGLGPFNRITDFQQHPLRPRLSPTEEGFNFPSLADIDGDGDLDLLVTKNTRDGSSVYSPPYTYYEYLNHVYVYTNVSETTIGNHTLFKNTGYELPGLTNSLYASFRDQGLHFIDIDEDGDLDAFTPFDEYVAYCGGAYIDETGIMFFKNDGTNNFTSYEWDDPANPFNGNTVVGNISFVDLDNDGDLDSFVGNIFFRNTGVPGDPMDNVFTQEAGPFDATGIDATSWIDLDNDGDMDAIVGDGNDSYFWRNDQTAFEVTSFVDDSANPIFSPMQVTNFGDYAIIPMVADMDGDGDLDVAFSGKYYISCEGDFQVFRFFENDGNAIPSTQIGNFYENNRLNAPFGGIGFGDYDPIDPAFVDLDGDGDLDFYIGTDNNGLYLYWNEKDIHGVDHFNPAYLPAVPFPLSDVSGNYLSPSFMDLDGDGDYDALIGLFNDVGLYHDIRYYYNIGSGSHYPNFVLDAGNPLVTTILASGLPNYLRPSFGDIDADGDLDLLVASDNTSRIFTNDGAGNFATGAIPYLPVNSRIMEMVDLDHDGDSDIAGGRNSSYIEFEKNRGLTYGFQQQIGAFNPFQGTYVRYGAPSFADLDGDGDLDMFAGSRDFGIHYFENTNAPPTTTLTGVPLNFTENGSAVPVDAGVTLDDPDVTDNKYIHTATITVDNFEVGAETLTFTDQPNITETWDAAMGVLTATDTASFAEYQALLQSLQFVSTSENPNTTGRSISFSVRDTDFTNPIVVSKTLNITAVNDPPVATVGALGAAFIENGPAEIVDAGFMGTDVDNSNLVGATITILSSLPEDQLLFTTQNGISGTYDSPTGTLTLSGTSSVLNYQTAIQSISYTNSSQDPDPTDRTISFQIHDGTDPSLTVTQTLTVTSVNDAPVVTVIPGPTNYPISSGPQVIDATSGVVDVDNTTLVGATITISSGFVSGEDFLSFTPTGGITGSQVGNSLILSGTATTADYSTVLRSITYENTASAPTPGSKDIDFVLDDGTNQSAPVTTSMVIVDDPPILAGSVGDLTYTEGDPNLPVNPSITITNDNPNLVSATVTIVGYVNGEDLLNVSLQGGITGTFSVASGILSLTGSAPEADYLAVLQSVTYQNTSVSPNTSTRMVDIIVNDGASNSNTASRNINVVSVNSDPSISGNSSDTEYTGVLLTLDNSITVSDIDDINLASAQVSISSGFTTDDQLAFTAIGSITGSYDSSTGILSLSGTGTLAEYQSVLQSVTFENTGIPGTTPRVFDFTVDDGNGGSATFSRTANINIPNLTPILSVSGVDLDYNENDGPVPIDTGITLSDDNTQQVSATVTISTGYQSGEDILSFADQNGITGSFDSGSAQMTLSGTADNAFYETALGSVAYENTSEDPDETTRTISFQISDGLANSTVVSTNINISKVNDAPTISGSSGNISYRSLTGEVVIDDQITITDVDDTDITGAVISVSSGFASGEDQLNFVSQLGISGVFNSITGTLSLSGTTTIANYQTALSTVTYENLASIPSATTKSISFEVSDMSLPSSTISRDIDVTDNQVVAAPITTSATVGGNITIDVLSSATITPGDVVTTVITIGPNLGVASVDASQAILYTPSSNASGIDQITYELCNQFGSCGTNVISLNIDNQAPSIAGTTVPVAVGGIATINLSLLISDANNNIDPNSFQVISSDSDADIRIDPSTLELIVDYSNSIFKDNVDHIIIEVCDLSGLCTQEEFVIVVGDVNEILVFNGVTPNNDGRNDFLKFRDVELFPNNELFIYNKIGSLVYTQSGYDNVDPVFTGIDSDGEELPNGTYYYVIELEEGKTQSGYFVLLR